MDLETLGTVEYSFWIVQCVKKYGYGTYVFFLVNQTRQALNKGENCRKKNDFINGDSG